MPRSSASIRAREHLTDGVAGTESEQGGDGFTCLVLRRGRGAQPEIMPRMWESWAAGSLILWARTRAVVVRARRTESAGWIGR